MEQYLHISGAALAPNEGVILASRPEAVTMEGTICSGDEVFIRIESQRGYQRRLWSGTLDRTFPLPQGQAVPWTEIPRQRTKKMMNPKLEHLIDRVLVPILVTRYLNRLKHVSLNCETAK